MSIYHGEGGYLDLLSDIIEFGQDIPDRTGIGCRAIFDAKIIYDVGREFPFSTVRPVPLRQAFEEMWFFLRGETQTKKLEEKGVNFWKGNTSREFLDSRGLAHLEEGDMGRAYGAQWRSFGKTGFDQFTNTVETLKKDPYSRRLVTTLWNPEESHLMALTPCWFQHQFVVLPGENGRNVLNLKLVNRSLDFVFGERFATQQYALLLVVLAKYLDMDVGVMSCDLTHVHVYANQLEYAKELLTRSPIIKDTPPRVEIKKDLNTIDDILLLQWDDFDIIGLEVNNTPFNTKRPPMAV